MKNVGGEGSGFDIKGNEGIWKTCKYFHLFRAEYSSFRLSLQLTFPRDIL